MNRKVKQGAFVFFAFCCLVAICLSAAGYPGWGTPSAGIAAVVTSVAGFAISVVVACILEFERDCARFPSAKKIENEITLALDGLEYDEIASKKHLIAAAIAESIVAMIRRKYDRASVSSQINKARDANRGGSQ